VSKTQTDSDFQRVMRGFMMVMFAVSGWFTFVWLGSMGLTATGIAAGIFLFMALGGLIVGVSLTLFVLWAIGKEIENV
jgi:hypothetical protein